MIDLHDVIAYLRPGAQFVTRGDEIEWHDENHTQPTQEEIDAEIARRSTSQYQLQDAQNARWLKIKAERDRRKSGGVLVDGKWFHTDADSRIQQLGLVLFGVNVPPVPWKTMDGTFAQMTQTLAGEIFQAVAVLDQALFSKAEQHKAAMMASADPANYDYSGGWPAAYGD